jgi:hypothetical protein
MYSPSNWVEEIDLRFQKGIQKLERKTKCTRAEEMKLKREKEEIRMNMAIYNLMELEPNLVLEVLMLLETCGAENSVYMSLKNLSTMST